MRKISGKLGDGIKSIGKKKDKDGSVDKPSPSSGGSSSFLNSLKVKDDKAYDFASRLTFSIIHPPFMSDPRLQLPLTLSPSHPLREVTLAQRLLPSPRLRRPPQSLPQRLQQLFPRTTPPMSSKLQITSWKKLRQTLAHDL